jgi:transmembrane sensor
MDDLARTTERLRASVDAGWDDDSFSVRWRALEHRRRRRSRVRTVAIASTFIVLAAGVTALSLNFLRGRDEGRASNRTLEWSIRFDDGSSAAPASQGCDMAIEEQSPGRTIIGLSRGKGRFEVTPNPARIFRVRAGQVEVTVLGTVFTVDRGPEKEETEEEVEVVVERGEVFVEWEEGAARLGQGQRGVFPPPSPSVVSEDRVGPSGAETKGVDALGEPRAPAVPPPASSGGRQDSRDDAQRSKRRMRSSTRHTATTPRADVPATEGTKGASVRAIPSDPVESLFRAADRASTSGHPEEALEALKRIQIEHADDPRAAMAAFTRGRILLSVLGRPREAADDFMRARELSPGGQLAEDALGREMEAWSRAGDRRKARSRAEEYLKRYAHGMHAEAARREAGLIH